MSEGEGSHLLGHSLDTPTLTLSPGWQVKRGSVGKSLRDTVLPPFWTLTSFLHLRFQILKMFCKFVFSSQPVSVSEETYQYTQELPKSENYPKL